MGAFVDLTGNRYGKLVVIALHSKGSRTTGHPQYLCRCDCGNTRIVRANNLQSGNTMSCGCLKKGNVGAYRPNVRRMYNSWRGMKARCNNPNNNRYHLYGGRGISICDEWQSFANFERWSLANGYADSLTIDRIDPDGNYCPDNCRWIPPNEQSSNRRCVKDAKKE